MRASRRWHSYHLTLQTLLLTKQLSFIGPATGGQSGEHCVKWFTDHLRFVCIDCRKVGRNRRNEGNYGKANNPDEILVRSSLADANFCERGVRRKFLGT